MSRKTPSFGQLVSYMSSEKADDHFDLYQHCLARGDADIADAFTANSKHLRTRKNGNYLYHEIVSISLEEGVDRKHAKECLREIALKYIADRCPKNMVYGCLHDDHTDHLHYHLMISANEQHQRNRLRLTTAQYDTVKRDLENHVLDTYPELKQKRIITAERDEKKQSHKASKQKQRTGKLERQDEVKATIAEAMRFTSSLDEFKTYLDVKRYRYYTRGKHYGVEVTHDTGKIAKYRFATIGIHDDFESYLATVSKLEEAQAPTEEPQDGTSQEEGSSHKAEASDDVAGEKEKEGRGQDQRLSGAEQSKADNEPYVKYDSSADLNTDPFPKQNDVAGKEPSPEAEGNLTDQQRDDFLREMRERRAKQKAKTDQQSQNRKGPSMKR